MRVLLVSDFLPPVRGGVEYHVQTLAQVLAGRGIDVHIATLTSNVEAPPPGVQIHTIPMSIGKLIPHEQADRPFHPPLPDPVARLGLARLVRAIRPDIVHGHSWSAVSLPRLDVPFVFTAHDYGLVCQLRTLLTDADQICSGPELKKCVPCGAARYGRAKSAVLAPATVVGRHLLRPDQFIAVSQSVAAALQPYVRAPIEVVYNFVPPLESEPTPMPRPRPYVMFAGDPGVHKGLFDLLAIWGGSNPPDVDLVIASTKPIDLPLPKRVTLVSLTREQMAPAWAGATAALIPSRWSDPCPTVVLEALRAGVPVLGYATGGIPEMVRDGVEGRLFPIGDSMALGAAVQTILDDSEMHKRMSVAALNRVKLFLAPAATARIVDIYEALLGTPAHKSRAG